MSESSCDERRDRELTREEHILGVGTEPARRQSQSTDGKPAAEQQRRHPKAALRASCYAGREPADRQHGERGRDPDHRREEEVDELDSLVLGQVRHDQPRRVETAPVAEAREDDVPNGRGDEPGQKRRNQCRPEADPRFDQHHSTNKWATEERRDRGEGPGDGEDSGLLLAETECGDEGKRDDRAECDHRAFRAEHRAEAERAEARDDDSRSVGNRCRRDADPLERLVTPITGEEQSGKDNDRRTDDG